MTDYTGRGGYYEGETDRKEEFCTKHNIKPAIKYRIGGWTCPCCELEAKIEAVLKKLNYHMKHGNHDNNGPVMYGSASSTIVVGAEGS